MNVPGMPPSPNSSMLGNNNQQMQQSGMQQFDPQTIEALKQLIGGQSGMQPYGQQQGTQGFGGQMPQQPNMQQPSFGQPATGQQLGSFGQMNRPMGPSGWQVR
jgi:hypothetical protein